MTTPTTDDRPTLPLLAGLVAYLVWGVVGYYFRILTHDYGVESFTLLSNRIVWSFVFLVLVLAFRRDLTIFARAIKTPRLLGLLAITSVLIATNWVIFIYASATGRLVQASLGYFLTPLLNVFLGVVLLREKLRAGQLVAIAFAIAGIAPIVYLKFGSVWIPLGLMFSFSIYGLMRKRIVVGPIVGLGVETAILLPLAMGYLAFSPLARPAAIPLPAYAMMMAAGVITAVPLMLFAYAARRLKLMTLGLLQYISPSVQFIVARFVAHEPVTRTEWVAFALIWLGLLIFSIDSVIGYRNRERSAVAAIGESPAVAVVAPLTSRA